jgi:hypothetical protein
MVKARSELPTPVENAPSAPYVQERVLHAHFSLAEPVFQILLNGEVPEHLHLLRGVDVLVRGEMVGDEHYLGAIEYFKAARLPELLYCYWRGYVIAE